MPLVGSYSEEEKTKPAILNILKNKYGIEEEDFASAGTGNHPGRKEP